MNKKEFFGELNAALSMSDEEQEKLAKLHADWEAGGMQGVDPVREYHAKEVQQEVDKLTDILRHRLAPYLQDMV
jgi:hypothetical protein